MSRCAGDGEAEDSFPDAGALHPADTALFVAAALRGYVLSVVPDGYRLQRRGAGAQSAPEVLSFKQVANQCGATGSVTLRAAAERDGLVWPVVHALFRCGGGLCGVVHGDLL